MQNSILPTDFSGAYVSCYSAANDYVEAAEKALRKLAEDGLHPEEVLQPVHEMSAANWSQHVSEMWPDQTSSLPNQIEFENAMKKGGVVYGPFGSYT
jgi:hypothetical protein